jgi:hypothetical protein
VTFHITDVAGYVKFAWLHNFKFRILKLEIVSLTVAPMLIYLTSLLRRVILVGHPNVSLLPKRLSGRLGIDGG